MDEQLRKSVMGINCHARRWRDLACCIAATVFVSLAVLGAARAADLPSAVQALVPAAKKEATATVYGQTMNPEEAALLSKGMSEFYGFPIKLNMIAGLHPQKAAEIIQQAKFGVPSGIDIFWTSASIGSVLDRGNVLADIDWTKDAGTDPELKFGDKGVLSFDGSLCLVIYNTDLVKGADIPRRYTDLLDPKWKGRIAFPRTPNPFIYISYALGEEKTASLLKDLVEKQEAKVLATYPDVRTRVSSGEFAIGVAVDAFVDQRKGAPVTTAPIEPVVLTPWGLFLMKDAKNTATAKLFAYWATHPDGQAKLTEVRELAMVTTAGSGLNALAQGKEVVRVPYDFMVDSLPRLAAPYSKIMGIR